MTKYKMDMEQIRKVEDLDFTLPETQKEVLSLIESLCKTIIEQNNEIQALKDEINRLKGEKGKFEIKSAKKQQAEETKPDPPKPKETKKWQKSEKNVKIKIDRVETVKLDKTGLPEDIEFKGYTNKIVQNIIIKTENVLYRMEKYYSATTKTTYTAEMEESLRDTAYGPETKALISTLYYENRVTENKIASFLNANGLCISEGTVSNILIKDESKRLTEIKDEVFLAGLKSSIYQQIDDTGIKIAGENGYATIIGNERYSAYFINESKSRDTVKTFLTEQLAGLFKVLVGEKKDCDAILPYAPQFKKIAERFSLCWEDRTSCLPWVHEDRHYKKLVPILARHKYEVQCIRADIWVYYDKLLDYKDSPTDEKKKALWDEFDVLFGRKTGYEDLDNRISLTRDKKSELLTVLDFPEIPLHNNLSENGLREIVVKRKISGGVETDEGIKAWENNMTILSTCKKLGLSFYEYMKGVFSKKPTYDLPELIN